MGWRTKVRLLGRHAIGLPCLLGPTCVAWHGSWIRGVTGVTYGLLLCLRILDRRVLLRRRRPLLSQRIQRVDGGCGDGHRVSMHHLRLRWVALCAGRYLRRSDICWLRHGWVRARWKDVAHSRVHVWRWRVHRCGWLIWKASRQRRGCEWSWGRGNDRLRGDRRRCCRVRSRISQTYQ